LNYINGKKAEKSGVFWMHWKKIWNWWYRL